MILMEKLRMSAGLSQLELGCKCEPTVAPSYISSAERHGFIYQTQLERVAAALGWDGNPAELMEDSEKHQDAVCRVESVPDISDEEKMKLAVDYYGCDSDYAEFIKTERVALCVFLNAGMNMRSMRDGSKYTVKQLHSDYVKAFGDKAPTLAAIYKIMSGKTELTFARAVEITALIDGEFGGYTFRLLLDKYSDEIMFNMARLWSMQEREVA